jgi:hemolysin III
MPSFRGRFVHSRAELIADGIIHAIGIVLAIGAGSALLTLSAFRAAPGEYVAAVFYVVSLLTVMSISCAYNLWPVSRAKWILRRFDHAAIYLLIAGTYTPFLAQLDTPGLMMLIVWAGAITGIIVKLVLPGRFDRLAVIFYLAIGWSGVLIFEGLREILSERTLWLVAAGGIVYTCGVVFFVWHRLRFQSAIWHGFVVTGAALHLVAVADCLVLTRL